MGKVTSIRWHMAHSDILIICSLFDVFLTKAFGINLGRTRTCNPQIRSLVPHPLGHKATLILAFRLTSRPSTFWCQKYWIHLYHRYSNIYSKFFIIPHGLSIEECCSAFTPYQGNVFLRWLRIRWKSFCFFSISIRRNSFCFGSVYGEGHFN